MTIPSTFTTAQIVSFNVWSASLPLVWERLGTDAYVPGITHTARPWNGRRLDQEELLACLQAFYQEWDRIEDPGLAVQAAYEWLSEYAR